MEALTESKVRQIAREEAIKAQKDIVRDVSEIQLLLSKITNFIRLIKDLG